MDVRRLLRSSTYLNCADLGGESVTVTISNVAEETVGIGSSSEQKAVVYFQGGRRQKPRAEQNKWQYNCGFIRV